MVKASALGHKRDEGAPAAKRQLEEMRPGVTCSDVVSRFPSMRPADLKYLVEGLALAGLPD
jgi:hypothetical protein